MGKEKTSGTSTQVINQTTTQTPQPTPEETALNQRNLRIAQATETGETQAQISGLNLINQLLTGQIPTSPLYQNISGISPEAISTQAAFLTRQNLPQFQQGGIVDSGVMEKAIARSIANELLFPTEQFNIGAKQNLLNLALTGQAQVQQPIQSNVNTLANSLAGLRSITGTTQGTTTGSWAQYGMNPFLKSFQQTAGKTLGGGNISKGSNWFGL